MGRRTSAKVYHQIEKEGLLNKLNFAVYRHLFQNGPQTTRQIYTGMARTSRLARDVGVVSSRVSALVRMNAVEEVGEMKCEITGRTVLVFDVTDKVPHKPKKVKYDKIKCTYCGGKGYVEQLRMFP